MKITSKQIKKGWNTPSAHAIIRIVHLAQAKKEQGDVLTTNHILSDYKPLF